jgi:hypothetical protein
VKPVLILQHQLPENAAYLATWLQRQGVRHQIVNAGADEEFPTSIEPYSALAVMGGGMSSNDPLLSNRQAEILILQAIHKDRPVIGHCLGGQLMARALGGTVQASPQPEIGWQSIEYEDTELTKEWFGDSPTDTVIQWHYESFSIPAGAVRLASSPACPNQAFAYGKHLAMQFHIEINEAKIDSWVHEDDPKWAAARQHYNSVQDKITILKDIPYYLERHQATADCIYTNWLQTTEWAVA